LSQFGYDVYLYTGQNADRLTQDLDNGRLDAVVLATNAMNDKAIRSEVDSPRFKRAVGKLLARGGGCLVLHQMRLGEQARDDETAHGALSLLPDALGGVYAMARPNGETAQIGGIVAPRSAESHVLLLYPQRISVDAVQKQCLEFEELKGLYWHYWDGLDASSWDTLLFDSETDDSQLRVLVACSKESSGMRVVVSSLTLDWQQQVDLLGNVMAYVVEGRHHTALLTTEESTTVGLSYLMERLRSERYPFRAYDIGEQFQEALRAIIDGVHSIVVTTSGALEGADAGGVATVRLKASEGKLKLIEIDEASFTVFGRERDALRLLYQIELKVQGELQLGYVDGSFWSTVDALQVLDRLPERFSTLDDGIVEASLAKAQGHDREGSYDEVFGVSCVLLWLRSRFLGSDSHPARRTARWIESRRRRFGSREQVRALLTLLESGVSKKRGTQEDDRAELANILDCLEIDSLSEIDAMVFLEAANFVDDLARTCDLVSLLCSKQQDGLWVDLATTASIATALLAARKMLTDVNSEVRDNADAALFASMVVIQRSKSRDATANYPWDEKASTSLKCIDAWLRFEDLIDMPVAEIIESLRTYARGDIERQAAKAGLEVLEDITGELRTIQKESIRLFGDVEVAREQMLRYSRLNRRYWISLVSCALFGYLLLSYLAYSLWGSQAPAARPMLLAPFVEGWGFHLAFLSLVATVVFGVFALRQVRQARGAADE